MSGLDLVRSEAEPFPYHPSHKVRRQQGSFRQSRNRVSTSGHASSGQGSSLGVSD